MRDGWAACSRSEDGDQDGHRSRVADRIQAADPVKHATQNLREAGGDGHSGDQAEQDGPGESAQHGGKDLDAIGSDREPDGNFFGSLRYGVADQTEQAHDGEEDGNAAQQADDGRDLLRLRNIFAKAGGERRDGWKKLRGRCCPQST